VKRFAALAALAALLCGCSSGPVRTYSADELDTAVQEFVDSERSAVLAEFPDAVLPEVEVVRYINGDEWSVVMASCLRDAGLDVSTGMDGGVSFNVSPGSERDFRVSYFVCQAQYPYDPRLLMPLDHRQLVYLYDYQVQVLRPCLEAHHFIDVTTPPTLEGFLRNEPHWDLYSNLASAESWRTMTLACPPEPPGLYGVKR
jgi:hypothetical protein